MKRIAVIDTETTGTDVDVDGVIEIGVTIIELDGAIARLTGESWESFVAIDWPVPPESSAIHHIVDEDLIGALPFGGVVDELAKWLGDVDLFVAHYAAFDRAMLETYPAWTAAFGGVPWACTMRLARKVWPDAPTHSNQGLRYWLNHDIPRGGDVHRARFDTLVTAHTLLKLWPSIVLAVDCEDMEAIAAYSAAPCELKKITFGKHRGELFEDLPIEYLRWGVRADFDDPDVTYTFATELARRHGRA